jgi:hypothetical protein
MTRRWYITTNSGCTAASRRSPRQLPAAGWTNTRIPSASSMASTPWPCCCPATSSIGSRWARTPGHGDPMSLTFRPPWHGRTSDSSSSSVASLDGDTSTFVWFCAAIGRISKIHASRDTPHHLPWLLTQSLALVVGAERINDPTVVHPIPSFALSPYYRTDPAMPP